MISRKVAFFFLLTAGVGFCINGIFVSSLLAVGATCLAGAIAVAQVQDDLIESIHIPPNDLVHPLILSQKNKNQDDKETCNLEADLRINHNRVLSYRLPKSFPDPDYGYNITDYQCPKASPRKTVHETHP
jgi:hypothetical protein